MTKRIAMWACVLLCLSGCLASHEDPNDVAGDHLGLENDSDVADPANTATKSDPAKKEPVANCGSPADSPPSPAPASEVEACEIKAKACYNESKNPEECDAVLKYCSTLSAAPKPEPDPCSLKVEKCVKTEDGQADCTWVQVECAKPPPPASSAVDSCWRKYKECYAYENEPQLCESVADMCKKLESADLE